MKRYSFLWALNEYVKFSNETMDRTNSGYLCSNLSLQLIVAVVCSLQQLRRPSAVYFIFVFLYFYVVCQKNCQDTISSLVDECLFIQFIITSAAEEPEEKYILSIYQVSGSADIADKQANITITVRNRGFPNGVFSFKSTPVQVIDEPDTGKETSLQFTVLRTRGAQGTVPVSIALKAFLFVL